MPHELLDLSPLELGLCLMTMQAGIEADMHMAPEVGEQGICVPVYMVGGV